METRIMEKTYDVWHKKTDLDVFVVVMTPTTEYSL